MSNREYGVLEEAAKALEARNAKILEALATVLASNIPSWEFFEALKKELAK